MRTRVAAAAVLIAGATSMAAAVPAHAAATKASIQPGRVVHLSRDGMAVTWQVRIVCPSGESYTLSAVLDDLSTDAPYYDGGDRGVRAVLDDAAVAGRCSGKSQVVKLRAAVSPGPDGTVWPMSRGGWVNTFVTVTTPTTSAFACQHEACADMTHDWKPKLR